MDSAFTIFRLPTTRFWQVRFKHQGRYCVRSLKTEDVALAREVAAQTVQQFSAHPALTPALAPGIGRSIIPGTITFDHAAQSLMAKDQRLVDIGQRNPGMNQDQRSTYKVHFASVLGPVPIKEINYSLISDFVDTMMDNAKSIATIKRNIVLLSKTLKHSHRMGWIDAMPPIPAISSKSTVRSWLSPSEYHQLLRYLVAKVETGIEPIDIRYNHADHELRLFATFMVNTFVRPSDAKLLCHRHIEVVQTKDTRYLRITTQTSKTVNSPIISMPEAVPIYDKLTRYQKAKGFGNSDQFIFMPKFANRDVALQHLRLQFQEALSRIGLKHARTGQTMTLYSLRHSAIMFRLLQGKSMDLLTLARNARTSVDMIDRFYAKHLTAEMNVDILHSKR